MGPRVRGDDGAEMVATTYFDLILRSIALAMRLEGCTREQALLATRRARVMHDSTLEN
jgi:hypothetical protein